MTSSPAKYRQFNRALIGAIVLVLFAAPGAGFSVFVTLLKFRVEQSCNWPMMIGCSSGCDITLADSWASLAGLPITVYSAALHLTMLALGVLAIARPASLLAAVRLPALAIAWLGLVVALLMAFRSFYVLGAFCRLCVVLYLVHIGLFLGAWLLDADGPIRGFGRGLRRLNLVGVVLCVLATAFFATAVLVQYNRYNVELARVQQARTNHDRHLSCRQRSLEALPPTAISLASDGPPRVVAGLFVDLSCKQCRRELRELREIHQRHRQHLRVDIFHYPMDPACGGPGNHGSSQHMACIGAAGLECMVARAPELALDLLEETYQLQDGPAPYFDPAHLQAISDRHDLGDVHACMTAVHERVEQHVQFAVNAGLHGAPGVIMAPMCGDRPSGTFTPFSGGKAAGVFEQAIHDAMEKASACDAG